MRSEGKAYKSREDISGPSLLQSKSSSTYALLPTFRRSLFPYQVALKQINNMSNTSKQHQGAARSQRTWSTTATHGSDDQARCDVDSAGATDTGRSSSGTDTPFTIQRWLAESPHQGPWNGMTGSRNFGEKADKGKRHVLRGKWLQPRILGTVLCCTVSSDPVYD